MKPLPHKIRRIMFWILLIIFIIITPFILAESLGYKIERINDIFKITEMGGIYIQSGVNNAQIYLNDKYHENNGLLIRNTLIQKLVPDQDYKIVIKKDGLHDWRKNLRVYPSVVTEARVLMLPVEIPKREITDLKYLVRIGLIEEIKTSTSTKTLSDKNTNLISDIKKDSSKEKISSENSTSSSVKLEKQIPDFFKRLGISDPDLLNNLLYSGNQVAWLEKGNIVVSLMDLKKTSPFYYCLEWNKCREQIVIDWDNEIKSFNFLPGRDDVLVILVNDGIYALEIDDRSERNIQPLYVGENLNFVIDERGQIVVSDSNKYYRLEL